ncbi:MAG TPA: T9SS type A sorting domain-containing protein [Bacteroidetes bacterium]|nr:T9SS type A sorting domain-containing protein [Bacteroidota bacterium]
MSEQGIGTSSIPAQQSVNFRDVDIIIDYVGNWPPDAMAAFDFAASIWAHHLTSTVPVRVEAEFAALPPGALGGARPFQFARDFNSDPQPLPNTWYPIALANKMAEEDLNPNGVDIVCQFVTDAVLAANGQGWNFDPDIPPAANEYDFATVVLHELAHGFMGGTSTVVSQFGVGVLGNGNFNGFPTIFDSFVIDCTNGDQLVDQPNNTIQLGNFLTNGNLCWGDENGNTNCMFNGNPSQLFAPNPFLPGSSISHLDDGTYPLGNPHSLMTPFVNTGEQVLQVGDLFLCMMEETGWMVDFTTGIEDELVIYEWPSLLNEGQNFEFRATFYDEEPYGDYINNNSHEWKIEPLNNNGFYPLLVTQSSMAWNYWPDQLPYLPATNYTWQRNPDGTIRTKATISADDNVGISHSDNVDIGIRFIPDQPELESDYLGCYEVKLTFYAPGATSYEIYYDTDPGVPYNGTGLPQGNSPITVSGNVNSITLTNLSPQYYFFNVRGKNSTGYSIYAVEEYELIPIEERDCGVVSVDECVAESLVILDISNVNMDDFGTVFIDLIRETEMATYYGTVGSTSIDLTALDQSMTFASGSDYVQIQDGNTYTVRMRYPLQGVYKLQEANFEVSNSLLCGRSSAGGPEDDVIGEPTPIVFEIVPNPANSFAIVNVNIPAKEAKVEIRVMGQLGQVLQNHALNTDNTKTSLDISGLPPGLYFVQLRLDNQPIETQRLVVSR